MHEKSKPRHEAKKPGKSIKQRRAEKRTATPTTHASVIPSAHPGR
jgi:hypothetical protein